jgi:uncharacterized protein (DUF924 family)
MPTIPVYRCFGPKSPALQTPLPYMHSESVAIHQEALRLFAQSGLENNLDFERRHLAILERFGRYPHRNAILDRESTPEEIEF